MKLGKRELDALVCPPGRRDMLVFDDELTGFAVRVTAAGTRTFLFQYRQGKTVRRLRLGEFGDITPAQARRLAEEARGLVAGGADPAADRRARMVTTAEAEREAGERVTRTSSPWACWSTDGRSWDSATAATAATSIAQRRHGRFALASSACSTNRRIASILPRFSVPSTLSPAPGP
jgi:hypothetical protein